MNDSRFSDFFIEKRELLYLKCTHGDTPLLFAKGTTGLAAKVNRKVNRYSRRT